MRTFNEFKHAREKDHGPAMSEADWVLHLIARAGPNGLRRSAIAADIKLPRDILDNLLQAWVGLGQISARPEGEELVYRLTRTGWKLNTGMPSKASNA